MKIYYVEDENGQFVSADGKKRWTRLSGKALHKFLQTERGRNTYFFHDSDEDGIYIEIRNAALKADFLKDKNHRDYLKQMQTQSRYVTVTFNLIETDDGAGSGEDVIADDSPGIIENIVHNEEINTLRRALKTLTEEEMLIIEKLYLFPETISTRELAKEMGVSQTVVVRRVNRILLKLKNNF